jgi:predicted alpha/beta hydrolase
MPGAFDGQEGEHEIEIEAPDGQRLMATLYTPRTPKAVVQIMGGIGVKRQYYRGFASYLASHGYAVLTFDFRGTGSSRPKSLRGYRAFLRDWGQKDGPAALEWLHAHFPDLPKFMVGHSMGGQQIGLMHNHARLSGIVLIFAATGHFRTFPMPFRLLPIVVLYLFFPLTIPLFGYAPARFVTTGEDLPVGIAREWIRWTLRSGYIAKHLRGTSGFYYPEITTPIRAFAVDDDPMATPENAAQFLKDYYSAAPTTFSVLRSREAPNGRVGHLGYFRRALLDAYWSQVLSWLDQRLLQVRGELPSHGPREGAGNLMEAGEGPLH